MKELIEAVEEVFLEAATPGRAGSKLKRIDELMSWLYDNDILNKSDKATKDTLFRKYYRWYNDGDIPKGKLYPVKGPFRNASDMPKDRRLVYEKILEKEITEFISKTLAKYKSKYSSKDYKVDKLLKVLNDSKAEYVASGDKIQGTLYLYPIKNYANNTNNNELINDIEGYETKLDELKQLEITIAKKTVDKIRSSSAVSELVNFTEVGFSEPNRQRNNKGLSSYEQLYGPNNY